MYKESMVKRLSKLVQWAQTLPNDIRWAFADSALYQSIDHGKRITRGSRGRILSFILRASQKVKIEWLAILGVAFYEAAKMWRAYQKPDTYCSKDVEPHIFVGFGAGMEEELFRIFAEDRRGVFRADQQRLESFNVDHEMRLKDVFRTVLQSLGRLKNEWPTLPLDAHEYRVEFLTHLTMRVARYCFFRTWFECYTKALGRAPEVCLISPDTLAFAAVDAGVISDFYQHGLMRLSGVFPDFTRVRALTADEASYLQKALPRSVIRSALPIAKPIENTRDRVVLVASIYGSVSQMNIVIPFLEWADAAGMTILVRRHPKEQSDYWSSLSPRFRLTIDDRNEPIAKVFTRVRPAIVVSWFSTAMVDALNYGLIPVMLVPNDDDAVRDLIYPLVTRTLNWPNDKVQIDKALRSSAARGAIIRTLKAQGNQSHPQTLFSY
ncbi:hypothetical protein F2Q65_14130 [Thiohalocapsa marina]|uniref:Uncharacterized protein n=1 Tax=Thiohalocapsa marina TaxID=424902 RepID=A0A5M8FLE8_9GAMM|nr:hypothetical protein [Thiohalocapsa marina]KAA6183941.1 hypothetical protein F2Q65_14130 [Thiohalocapsa marina]